MHTSYTVGITTGEYKALQYVMTDQEEWITNAIKHRADNATKEIQTLYTNYKIDKGEYLIQVHKVFRVQQVVQDLQVLKALLVHKVLQVLKVLLLLQVLKEPLVLRVLQVQMDLLVHRVHKV